jgi:hypothetical protein
MTSIVLAAGVIGSAASFSDAIVEYAVLFVAAQTTLAYAASGIAKVSAPIWRNGEALAKIMNHYSYGHENFAAFLQTHTMISSIVCWLVIAFQVTFPAFYILPLPYAAAYPASGVIFHAAIAYIMRLNLFLFSFVGTYPCLIYAYLVMRA